MPLNVTLMLSAKTDICPSHFAIMRSHGKYPPSRNTRTVFPDIFPSEMSHLFPGRFSRGHFEGERVETPFPLL